MTEPILTPGAQEGVTQGYADVAAGRTVSVDEARERLGIERTDEDTTSGDGEKP